MSIFKSANILLPRQEDNSKWAVIACDQFTSQPEYWDAAARLVGAAPSALNLILPEARLAGATEETIEEINTCMREYLQKGIFEEYPDSYVYVERTLKNGAIRRGIVGAVDLEAYEAAAGAAPFVRPTEKTVMERIPPRVKVRENAVLELPHSLLLCDDEKDLLLGSVEAKKDTLPLLYDFDLMLSGGHISGYLLSGEDAAAFSAAVEQYCSAVKARYEALGLSPILFAVGDGNHSLATAKACYEQQKKDGADASCLARYALVELENIHDDAQQFEPIHRILSGVRPADFIRDLTATLDSPVGTPVTWVAGSARGTVTLDTTSGQLPIAILQKYLDSWLSEHDGEIDYIHGDDTVVQMAKNAGCVGLLLPSINKNGFFTGISVDGVLPRKTFSMGHAEEKRYYMEARKIR